jgi:hypothetical protein
MAVATGRQEHIAPKIVHAILKLSDLKRIKPRRKRRNVPAR